MCQRLRSCIIPVGMLSSFSRIKRRRSSVNRDYSKLDKTLIITDMYETDDEPIVLGGVAIRAEDLDDFIKAVEKLAVEQFDGATFTELLDKDLEDEAAFASSGRYTHEQIETMLEHARRIFDNSEL